MVREHCQSPKAAVEAARKAVWKQKIFTKGRKEAEKKLDAAQKKLGNCKKQFSKTGAILYARALARAAQDTKQKFALKPDFAKKAGTFKADDAVVKAFKVRKIEDAVLSGKKLAKKMGLEKAAEYAATSQALKDTLTGTTVGFIAAQVGAAVVDVVGSFVTLGAYAAAAPAVHAAIAGGQTVTTALIQKDIALNEQKYKGEIEKYFAKKDISTQKRETAKADADMKKIEQMQKSLDEKTADPAPASEPVAGATKPWYTSTGVLIGGGLLAGLAIYAATRNNPRA
jgi:hypothetical protein